MTKWVLGDQQKFTATDLALAWEMGRDGAAKRAGIIDRPDIRALTAPVDLAEKVSG